MPALPPYIPTKDSEFGLWIDNFSALITAAPGTYGLVAGDAAAIAGVTATWDAAYALVTSPLTKTAATVGAKNNARVSALATARPYAVNISRNAGVLSADKIALGVNPLQSVPTPITPPTTNPILTIANGASLQHYVRYRDSTASPSVKAKPYGVRQVQIYAQTSPTAITDPSLIAFAQLNTKAPFIQTWPGGSTGKIAYYAARWVTIKGQVGPWSPIVSAGIM